MKRIIGLGNALVDVMTILDSDGKLEEFGLPKGSMQMVDLEKSNEVKRGTSALKKSLAAGGSAANTIHGLGVLGVDCGFIGSVGDDDFGRIFSEEMMKGGVRPYLTTGKLPSGNAVALISKDSERTFATYLGAATELKETDIKEEVICEYDILYIEGYMVYSLAVMTKACEIASSKGVKVALDLASFNVVAHMKSEFKNILERYVDILFANEDEARAYTGLEPEDAVDELGRICEIAVVKTGSKGSIVVRGEEKLFVGPRKSRPADTTGAGDLYAAGFLYGLANCEPLEFCGAAGSLIAGNVIEVIGPKMDDKRWKTIKGELEKMR